MGGDLRVSNLTLIKGSAPVPLPHGFRSFNLMFFLRLRDIGYGFQTITSAETKAVRKLRMGCVSRESKTVSASCLERWVRLVQQHNREDGNEYALFNQSQTEFTSPDSPVGAKALIPGGDEHHSQKVVAQATRPWDGKSGHVTTEIDPG